MIFEEHSIEVGVCLLHVEQILIVLVSLSLHALVATSELSIGFEKLLGGIHHVNLNWTVEGCLSASSIWVDSLEHFPVALIIVWSAIDLI